MNGLPASNLRQRQCKLAEKVADGAKGGGGKDEAYSQEQLDLARRHPSVFSDSLPAKPQARWPDGTEYARLRLQPGVEPRSRKQYRIPDALRPQLQKTIEELARHGLIEVQTGSPYNSPILFAPKPNSTEMRFCFDSRELNKALLDHPYPSPTSEELFDRVARLMMMMVIYCSFSETNRYTFQQGKCNLLGRVRLHVRLFRGPITNGMKKVGWS